jgi:hypothetical protein
MNKKPKVKNSKEKQQSQAASQPETSLTRRKYIYLSLILLLTVLLFSNSVKNQFVSYDDENYIQDNEHIKSLSSKNLSNIFQLIIFQIITL